MKFTINIETEGRGRSAVREPAPVDTSAARQLVETAWGRVIAESGEERTRARHWVGGAIAVLATVSDESAERILAELEARRPVPADPAAVPRPVDDVTFREGRSTPPPPRHPGAQRPVDEVSTS